jgi:hypothetical protein
MGLEIDSTNIISKKCTYGLNPLRDIKNMNEFHIMVTMHL